MAATTSGFWGSELVEVMFGCRYQAVSAGDSSLFTFCLGIVSQNGASGDVLCGGFAVEDMLSTQPANYVPHGGTQKARRQWPEEV
jgi:hypothetical protein